MEFWEHALKVQLLFSFWCWVALFCSENVELEKKVGFWKCMWVVILGSLCTWADTGAASATAAALQWDGDEECWKIECIGC